MYCYLFISFQSSATYYNFQLVSCPFRLRLVILSFCFVGKQLLVFFVCGCCFCCCCLLSFIYHTMLLAFFPYFYFSSFIFSHPYPVTFFPSPRSPPLSCLNNSKFDTHASTMRDALLTDSMYEKCWFYTHGIFRFDMVKTFRFNVNKWFHRNREVDYTLIDSFSFILQPYLAFMHAAVVATKTPPLIVQNRNDSQQ